ncbi:hypothetical protein AB0C87_06075 [Actinomadura sp. NPDC048021]|uniref:hypothetical protein n=1 Tax=Actinomadura sp. NPDC048021 TaxID=3155385 RepID=UPI0034068603
MGSALLQTGHWPAEVAESWGQKKVSPLQRVAEYSLEKAVSDHIATMPLLWLEVPNRERRKFIRANSIALLSRRTGGIDRTALGWLGLRAKNEKVATSGLWNSDHVDDLYDPSFLDDMEACVKLL